MRPCLIAILITSLSVVACKQERTSPEAPVEVVTQKAVPEGFWKDTEMTAPLEHDDPRIKDPDFYFVTATRTSICPSIKEAMARECGHSVEFGPGYRLGQGKTLPILKGTYDSKADTLPTIRYMVEGLMPAYVAREDVAKTPDMSHRDTFIDTLSITSTHSAPELTQKKLAHALRHTKSTSLIHITGVKPLDMTHEWRSLEGQRIGFDLRLDDSAQAIVVDFPVDMEEFMIPAFIDEEYFPEDPNNYRCDERYCDEIDLIFSARSGQPAKLLHVIDRFGVHTMRTL